MSQPAARTFTSDFKRFFVRGLVVLLPSILTLWIMVKAYQFVDSTIAEPINGYVRLGIAELTPHSDSLQKKFDPSETDIAAAAKAAGPHAPSNEELLVQLRYENIHAWWSARWYMNLIGLAVAIVGVYIAGRLLGGFVGRRVYREIERVFASLPLFRQIYPYIKQVVDFLFSDERSRKFSRVVICEYPRKGIWAIGFQTGSGLRVPAGAADDLVSVFIPSSPSTFTGYTITLPRREVIELPITVEEAIRFVVSAGVVLPSGEAARPGIPEPLQSSNVSRTPRAGRDAATENSAGQTSRVTAIPPPEPAS